MSETELLREQRDEALREVERDGAATARKAHAAEASVLERHTAQLAEAALWHTQQLAERDAQLQKAHRERDAAQDDARTKARALALKTALFFLNKTGKKKHARASLVCVCFREELNSARYKAPFCVGRADLGEPTRVF